MTGAVPATKMCCPTRTAREKPITGSYGDPVATLGDTRHEYGWASVTKPVTALACLVAAEEGTIDLDEPAGPPGATVRHLLAHASGLPPGLEAPPAKPSAPGRKSGAPPALLRGASSIARPGERRIYSDQGFDVLGEVLAEHAEMEFGDYLDVAVLKPLGLAARFEERPGSGLHGSLDDLLA